MLEKIKRAAAMKLGDEKPQCFVLFILSHGGIDKSTKDKDEGPLGTDGNFLTKKRIIDELDRCQNLHGVPRLVFFQCCRGGWW